MLKQTPKSRVLFVRRFTLTLLVLFGVFSLLLINFRAPRIASAASASTLNFQARLQTAAGGIVPDGNYNIEFKLYTGASCNPATGTGCTSQWTEDYTNSSGKGLQTVNGYFSTALGSVTALPSNFDWSQQLWLSMNIGGTSTGAVTWDGEMKPFIQLTAVPYAFKAAQASELINTTGTYSSSLDLLQPSSGNQIFQIPDQGTAGTYSLLTNKSGIQNQSASPQAADFNVSGTGTAGTFNATTALQTGGQTRVDSSGNLTNIGNISGTGNLQMSGTSGNSYLMSALGLGTVNPQTGSALTIANSQWISGVDSTGNGYVNMFQVNSSNQIQVGAALNVDGGIILPTNGGQLTFADLPIDTSAAAGTAESYSLRVGSSNVLTVYGEADGSGNMQNGRVAIGSSISPAYTLDVGGDINTTGSYRAGGTQGVTQGACSGGNVFSATTSGGIVTGGSCTAVALGPGSTYYIQNGTSPQTADFNITGTGAANILQAGTFDTSTAGALNLGTTNATSVVLKQNTSVASGKTLTVNGSGFDASGNLGIGTTSPGANIDLRGGLAQNAMNITTTSTVTSATNVTNNSLNINRSITTNLSSASITLDTSATKGTTGTSSNSLSFTVGNYTNRYLLVAVGGYSLTDPTPTLSYNGTSMTLLGSQTNAGATQGEQILWIFGLKAPSTGTHTLQLNDSTADEYTMAASSWYNVDQTTPTSGFTSTSGTSTVSSLTVSSVAGQVVVDTLNMNANSANRTGGSGQNALFYINDQPGYYAAKMTGTYKNATGTSTTMTETAISGSVAWEYIALALNPVSVTGASISGAVAQLSSNCTVTSGTCADSSNILSLNQQYTSATGAVAVLQNAGSGDMIDFLNGSGSTVTSLSATGNFTTIGTGAFKVTSASAFSVQSASGAATFLNVDTTGTGTITLGSAASGNYVTFTAAGGLTAYGTAQHGKSITLTAEYAGAVLDAASDSSCSSATNGTMTSGYDSTNFHNYYKWASNATAQCYDIVVRVPIPQDWSSWSSTTPLSITGYTNNTSTSTLNLQVINGSNSTETSCNYVNVTPGSTSTWSANTGCTFASTTSGYSAGGVMTLKIRMTGNASSDVRVGNITLNYNSKY